MNNILKNWKTSLAGLAAGILHLAQAWPDEARRLWGIAGGLVLALFGLLTKDASNKNGEGK